MHISSAWKLDSEAMYPHQTKSKCMCKAWGVSLILWHWTLRLH